MTARSLVLEGPEYDRLVPKDLDATVKAWNRQVAETAPGAIYRAGDGPMVAVERFRWAGEGYVVDVYAADEDGYVDRHEDGTPHLIAWSPPVPPPADLMRYAVEQEVDR